MTDWLARRHRQTHGGAMNPHTVRRCLEALPHRLNGTHLPDRPGWTCPDCGGAEWPCSPARTALTVAHGPDRTALAAYVGVLLFAAAGDLPTTPAAELHERFVAWTR